MMSITFSRVVNFVPGDAQFSGERWRDSQYHTDFVTLSMPNQEFYPAVTYFSRLDIWNQQTGVYWIIYGVEAIHKIDVTKGRRKDHILAEK